MIIKKFSRNSLFWKATFTFSFVFILSLFMPIGKDSSIFFQDPDVTFLNKLIIIFFLLLSIFFLFTNIEIYKNKIKEGIFEISYNSIFSVTISNIVICKGVLFTLNNGRGYIVFHCMMKRPEEFVYSLYMALKKANNNIVMSDDFVATARSYANKNKFEFGE